MEKSKIQWTQATINFWTGCKKVSAGCKYCYMFRDKERYGQNPEKISRVSDAKFKEALKWQQPKLIFTCSWSDFFIEEADQWRKEAWEVIRKTPHHRWQILTKRPERILECLPPDWGEGWDHVWLDVTVENNDTLHRIKTLSEVPAKHRFISAEPILEKLDLTSVPELSSFHWVLVGGESGNKTGNYLFRTCELSWIEDVVKSCRNTKIPVFVKQLGSFQVEELKLSDRHGGDISEWPEYLRIREYPIQMEGYITSEAVNGDPDEDPVEISDSPSGPTLPLGQMLDIVSQAPELRYVFRGIIHPSVGVIFGPAKSGKTITGESLLMAIASGQETFMGERLYSPSRKVMIIGLEEFYRNRIRRNGIQAKYLAQAHGLNPEWVNNVFVADDQFPRYFRSEADWRLLESEISKVKPAIVMIDSLTRLTVDPIEESTVANDLMRRLREISHRQNVVFLIIHHTQKIENRPLTLATLAGSRVIGQEMDFMIGINRTEANDRYMKDVAYRYAPDDTEKVLTFTINDSLLVQEKGAEYETTLLARTNELNESDQTVLGHFLNAEPGGSPPEIQVKALIQAYVDTEVMSKPTLYAVLKRLQNAKRIQKIREGVYSLHAAS